MREYDSYLKAWIWYDNPNKPHAIHRIGAPAIEYDDGTWEYWANNCLHNIYGPSAIPEGKETWVINGLFTLGKILQQWMIDNNIDWKNLSTEDRIMIELRWGEYN